MKLKHTDISLRDYSLLLERVEKLEKEKEGLNKRIDLIVEMMIKFKNEI